MLKRVVALNAISEYEHIRHRVCVPSFSQESVPAKMTTNVAAEEVPESKAATPVKRQIVWHNLVLLTVIHLMALYTAVFLAPRAGLFDYIWRKFRLSCLFVSHLHKHLSIPLVALRTDFQFRSSVSHCSVVSYS